MHEETAYNSRIREEYELSFNNGSSAKITPCPWVPKIKKKELISDEPFIGKSVLTCLLELHRDLLFAVVKDLKADGKWFKLLFQSAADLRSALTAIVWAINTDVVRREVIDVVHSIDGGNFPEEPLYIPYREEQFVQPIIR